MQFSVLMKHVIYVILETDDNDDTRPKHEWTTSEAEAIHIYLLEQPVSVHRR
jgi:hypothetical protein